ncbi:hypothetical protein FGB62_161g00 [Gracilaria domingensis]|nr:hypothetical protein FGB62_161g00 [Gracilaria domingensis]
MSSVELSAVCTVQLNDLRRRWDSALANVQQVSLGSDQLGESIEESPIRQYIQTAEASLVATQRTLDTLQSLSKQIQSMKTSMTDEETGNDQRQDEAIITMDSVRIALRRLHHGESAARTQLSSSGSSRKDTAEGQTFSKKTTSNSNERECWIFNLNHFACENPLCKKSLESKRELRKTKKNQKPNRGDDQTEFPPPDDEGSSSKNATLNTSLDILYSSMTLNPIKDSSTKKELCSIIVDGGAKGTVVGKSNYNRICKALDKGPLFKPKLESDCTAQAFGTSENKLQSQDVYFLYLLETVKYYQLKRWLWMEMSHLTLGRDNLQTFKAIESHARERLSLMKNEKRV